MFALLFSAALALAGSPEIPAELQPWVSWVLADHPELDCAFVEGARTCDWPGSLALDADADGAAFELVVQVDKPFVQELPGGPGAWPAEVTVDGVRAVVTPRGDRPTVRLEPGTHRVRGALHWESRPPGLAVPGAVGLLELRVDGALVAAPRQEGGKVLLGKQTREAVEEDRLSIEVSRLLRDGIPLVVSTQLQLAVSGAGREVDLGEVAVSGTHPASLTAQLPAHFDERGHLIVQARPGSWTVSFDALALQDARQLQAPALEEPWPEVEYWAVQETSALRTLRVSGNAVDGARTSLPEEWRRFAAYAVPRGDGLALEEQRRGEAVALPNQLAVDRTLWLDFDGGGFTVRDRISGTVNQGWRLDAQAPLALGHVTVRDVEGASHDALITRSIGGAPGVELRAQSADVTAESRLEARAGALPAVGWATDVTRLTAQLRLPPGYELLLALGVDEVGGSLVGDWTLFDFFFVLVVSLAAGKLLGWRWGGVALLTLALTRHVPGAPQWLWAFLIMAVALGRVAGEGVSARLLRGARVVLWLILLLVAVPLVIRQVQSAVAPVNTSPAHHYGGGGSLGGFAEPEMKALAMEEVPDRYTSMIVPSSDSWEGDVGGGAPVKQRRYLSAQLDPAAVMQTGPGVPEWEWKTAFLVWSGPVTSEQTMRLVILPPWATALLALLRSALVLLLGAGLAGLSLPRLRGGGAAPAAMATFLAFVALPVRAAPPPELLQTLEQRLTVAPDCGVSCADALQVDLDVREGELALSAEVHAASATAWTLPGPASAWQPASVFVDGRPTSLLRRTSEGLVQVRLEPGVHAVRAVGPIPGGASVKLRFHQPPRRVRLMATDWALDGVSADGIPQASVQLTRLQKTASGQVQRTVEASSENLQPWLAVERRLDLGMPWRVHTTLRRRGSAEHPLTVAIPLLPGENVADGRVEVREGRAVASLQHGEAEVSWSSALDESERLELQAAADATWAETWSLSCGAMFRCTWEGVAPWRTVQDGSMNPEWLVWPGEQVLVHVSRPPAVPGQTATVDSATLELRPGRRLQEATLTLSLRASEAGTRTLALPERAVVQELSFDGQSSPLRPDDQGRLALPVRPGHQQVRLRWQEERPARLVDTAPQVDLGGAAVNLEVSVSHGGDRWIVALFGPRWGPRPMYWSYLVALALLAPLLARIPWTPLRTWQWLLLGLGMVHLPALLALVVAGWFVAMGYRREHPPERDELFNLGQLVLIGYTLVAMGVLYGAVYSGLILDPDMQIRGFGSSPYHLVWRLDRTEGLMPRPAVVWLPMWAWRAVMLAWSLWLAASVVGWARWAWASWATGGVYRAVNLFPPPKKKGTKAASEEAAAPDTQAAEPREGPTGE